MLNLSFPRKCEKRRSYVFFFETFVAFSVKNSPGFVVFVPPTEKCVLR